MVLVERPKPIADNVEQPDKTKTSTAVLSPKGLQSNPPQQDDLDSNVKFFPSTLTSSTDSGLLNVNKPVEITLSNPNPLQSTPNPSPKTNLPDISESEIRKRTIMLSVLLLLVVILVVTTCVLFVQKNKDDGQVIIPPDPDPNIKKIVKPQPAEPIDPIKPVEPPKIEITPTPPLPKIEITPKPDPNPNSNVKGQLVLPNPIERDPTNVTSDSPPEEVSQEDSTENLPETKRTNSVDDYWEELKTKNKKQQLNNVNNPTKRIDISSRLRQQIVGLKFDKVALVKVIRVISELTEIPISFDVEEIRAIGGSVDMPITGKFSADGTGEILDKILAPLNLAALIENDQLTITVLSDKRNELIEEAIDVSDIVKGTSGGDQLTLPRLVEIINLFIDPAGLDISTGENNSNVKKIEPRVRVVGESISIYSNRRRINETVRLLEQIRLLRGLEQKTKIVEGDLAPEVFGWDNVDVLVTLNYYRETPLAAIFKQIEKMCGILIIVDYKGLHRSDLSFDQLQGTVQANKITLNNALEQLLASIDGTSLTYRIVGSNIIELTTTHVAKQPDKMSVEIHHYTTEKQPPENNVTGRNTDETNNDNNDDKKTPEQIVADMRAMIDPTSWNDNDIAKPNNTNGKNNNNFSLNKGSIVIDHPSSCLIIRQPQPIQRQIRTWFK
jgi:hypothetical protein